MSRLPKTPSASIGWWHFQDAPLNVMGQVWCAEMGDRADCLGVVRQGRDGGRFVQSAWGGHDFTHWHPIARPPQREVDLEDALLLAHVCLTYPQGEPGERLSSLLTAILHEGVWTPAERTTGAELRRLHGAG